jgi:hypothetical protein
MYLAPAFSYQLAESWNWDTRFVWGMIQQDRFGSTSVDKALCYEIDTGVMYRPHSKLTIGLDLAFLMPGSAFKGGVNDYPTDSAFGAFTKAAVSF